MTQTNDKIRIIAAVITNENHRILLLKRSQNKKHFPNQWDIVAGKIEANESPEQAARREIKEETGFDCFAELNAGKEYNIEAVGTPPVTVYPFRIKIKTDQAGKIKLNHEHTAFKWADLGELSNSDDAPLDKNTTAFYEIQKLKNENKK